jgi:chemotaxis protein MotB
MTINIGDRWTAFKRVKRVYHPESGDYLGELIRILALLEVTALQEQTVSAKVVKSFDVIFRGDEVTPFVSDSLDTPQNTSPPGSLQGYIVEVKEQKVLNGPNDVVYLDKGRQHGVSAGDRFNITRTGERTSYFSPGRGVQLPGYIIGQIEVLGAQEITATARVLKSSEAVVKGDRIESP